LQRPPASNPLGGVRSAGLPGRIRFESKTHFTGKHALCVHPVGALGGPFDVACMQHQLQGLRWHTDFESLQGRSMIESFHTDIGKIALFPRHGIVRCPKVYTRSPRPYIGEVTAFEVRLLAGHVFHRDAIGHVFRKPLPFLVHCAQSVPCLSSRCSSRKGSSISSKCIRSI